MRQFAAMILMGFVLVFCSTSLSYAGKKIRVTFNITNGSNVKQTCRLMWDGNIIQNIGIDINQTGSLTDTATGKFLKYRDVVWTIQCSHPNFKTKQIKFFIGIMNFGSAYIHSHRAENSPEEFTVNADGDGGIYNITIKKN